MNGGLHRKKEKKETKAKTNKKTITKKQSKIRGFLFIFSYTFILNKGIPTDGAERNRKRKNSLSNQVCRAGGKL